MPLSTKDLIGLRTLSKKDLEFILSQAVYFKEVLSRPIKQVPALRGKTIVNLFCEPSTRTRCSFDMAIKNLSASALTVSVNTSSVTKGESLLDTVKNLEAMGVDAFIIRHSMGGVPKFIADHSNIPIINAGDGFCEHPTQALLDIFTMQEEKGYLKGKKVVILGDIKHSRVARSNIWGLKKLGCDVVVCGPPTLIPEEIEKTGVKVCYNLQEALADADFINVLRIQMERQRVGLFPSAREYHSLFGINRKTLKYAKKDVTILHPGPINRGVEITSEIADGPYNVILHQVTNGIAIRMAVLFLLLTKRNKGQTT
ncbi:MAG: aspartate carbamoyltransferase [Candidatus Margulisiibacteriota bacterium]|nr:MAG: aspartate carbamoyltransferase [Candidatus Margulisbacteria bacterium GWD2_39_127]OGI03931.1 MAG: aspartate carbamoyltransferase [Candidatus Margulisbacteria bacterium GWF2_38_17]OGI08201.1 MAG: aspartate carbamoyltransferase [Candidatus Margulisbacteria bacterium GWE2_39_32]PZM79672.1 MAG: aspartate carbamoyltransferase [Candidatus Margulisiibacteriota bacterium]HAR61935.1 aspartate carbamoyltransferase [Candidatus Margulisiibacteriota bacterium]